MYIKKYWYNYIGGTDDSLTLVDYLYDKGKTEIPLSEIFNDTGLSKLNWNFHISPNLEYIDSEGQCHEFYYAIDLATDLAALILESKKSGGFNIKNLFDGEKRDRFVKIITTPEEDQAMNRALAEFCASPLEYVWGDRIFEKCGIRRDEGGDGGKTLEIRGKRRLSSRDGGANYQQS